MPAKIDRQFIILVLIIFVALAGLFVVTKRLVDNTTQISQTNKNINQENLKRDKYQDLLSQYQKITAEKPFDTINDLLPNTKEFIKVVEDLEKIAQLSNNTIIVRLGDTRLTSDGFEIDTSKVRDFNSTSSGPYDSITIEATIRGDFAGLEQFLNLIKQSKYFLSINSLKITRSSVGTKNLIDTFMTIQVYVEKVIII